MFMLRCGTAQGELGILKKQAQHPEFLKVMTAAIHGALLQLRHQDFLQVKKQGE